MGSGLPQYRHSSSPLIPNLQKMFRPKNDDSYRNGSNKVLGVPTDHCFCQFFTNATVLILVNNKPVLNDIFLLKIESLLMTKFEVT